MPDIMDLPILDLPLEGQVIDGFELLEIIGEGRYARLFKAHDKLSHRVVAMKFPSFSIRDAGHKAAFVSEIWAGTQVSSPWIAEILILDPERQTRLYSVMPWYEGEMLEHRLLRSPPMGFREALAITIRLAKGVDALNRKHIHHRDIKPANIILQRNGDVKLLDLGVARMPGINPVPDQPVPGTPGYMAPEMFDGASGDDQTEVYALGVTLFRMLTAGQFPYGEIGRSKRPRQRDWNPTARYREDLPQWFDAVIRKAIAIGPRDRYADSMELAYELETG